MVELDELFAFVGKKKRMLFHDAGGSPHPWHSRLRVAFERTEDLLQAMVDEAPQAEFYYSDLFATYRNLIYAPGRDTPMPDKSETYRVEGDNAELRHYLTQLGRRSRCFSLPTRVKLCARGPWNEPMQVETAFSLLRVACRGKRLFYRQDRPIAAHFGYLTAMFNVCQTLFQPLMPPLPSVRPRPSKTRPEKRRPHPLCLAFFSL